MAWQDGKWKSSILDKNSFHIKWNKIKSTNFQADIMRYPLIIIANQAVDRSWDPGFILIYSIMCYHPHSMWIYHHVTDELIGLIR